MHCCYGAQCYATSLGTDTLTVQVYFPAALAFMQAARAEPRGPRRRARARARALRAAHPRAHAAGRARTRRGARRARRRR
eukprot:COSAG02_NODE_396_length_23126_cov_282.150258_19_plen_80_part_00